MSCVRAAFQNVLLKERQKERETGREDKKEDVSSCLMTLKKREDTMRTSCLPKHVIKRKTEGKRDGRRRQKGRHKQLLNDIKETRGYWNMKDGTLWRTCFRRSCGLFRKRDYGIKNRITFTAL